MKHFLFIILIACLVSCKKDNFGSMIVIKDCTGSYLRFNNKDYPICNEVMLDRFSNGAIVKANIIKIKECTNDRIHCCSVHPHEMELDGPYSVIWISR